MNYAKADRWIGVVEEATAIAALAAITVLVTAQVFLRYALDTGVLWIDEVVTILMVAMVLFGVPAVVRHHMETELLVFVEKLTPRLRFAVRLLTHLVGLAFIALFLFASVRYVLTTGTMVTTVLRIPVAYVYALLPAGALLLLYEYAKAAARDLRTRRGTL